MKLHIKISKPSLAEALNSVQAVVAPKGPMPILQNVKIEAKGNSVKFTCTDLDTTIITNTDCEVLGEGAITIPAKPVAASVGKLADGIIEIEETESNNAVIKAGSSVFRFKGIPAADFPTVSANSTSECVIPAATLKEMIRKTSFSVSVDESRRALCGVLLDFQDKGAMVNAVGTDGRRLSLLKSAINPPCGIEGQFILPRKAFDILLKRLPKEGNAKFMSAKNQIWIQCSSFEFFSKLIDSPYPSYMRVVPSNEGTPIIMSRVELLGALDRMSVFSAASQVPVVGLTFADNKVVLKSSETAYGSFTDEIPVKYDGEPIQMNYTPQYLRDALSAMDEDEIAFCVSEAIAPTVIRKADSKDYTNVVMPVRV